MGRLGHIGKEDKHFGSFWMLVALAQIVVEGGSRLNTLDSYT